MTTLNDLLHLNLDPLVNNIVASQIQLWFYKMGFEITSRLFKRPQCVEIVLCSSFILFWPLFDTTDWSWRLNALLPAIVLGRLFYKGAILKDPDDVEVQCMSKSSSPSDLLFGPLLYCAVLIYLGLYQFMAAEAAIIAAAGIGDSLAPIIGQAFGRHNYQMPFCNRRTMEGSLVGVFLGTVCGCYLYSYALGFDLEPLGIVIAYGGIAAVMEGTSPTHLDNLFLPLILHFSIPKVREYLPSA